MQKLGLGLEGEDITDKQTQKYLSDAEYKALPAFKNAAAQMIDVQSQELATLRKNAETSDLS